MAKKIIILGSCPLSLINFRQHLMQAWLALGFEVVAMAPDHEEIKKELAALGIKFIPSPLARNGLNPIKDIYNLYQLTRILRKERADYILNYTIKPVIYGSIGAKLAGIPHIYSMVTGTGFAFSNQSWKSRLVGRIAQQLYRIALTFNTKVFFQNKDNAEFFIEKKMLKQANKIVLVNGSGVDTTYFYPSSVPESISFLMVARLLRDKGVLEYVGAAKEIKQHFPHIQCKLVGWIDTNPNSIKQEELDHWIQAGWIEYLGRLKDVRQALAETSVYVLPSYAEGTPRSVLEAMSMSRPIITTDVPGCKETVIPHENGLLVRVKSVPELVKAMRFFIENREQVELMGKRSRDLALKKYDVHQVNATILTGMQIN